MENQNNNPMLAMFNKVMESANSSTTSFTPRSEGTDVLRINMNDKRYQGQIIFVPIPDMEMRPCISSVVSEVTSYYLNSKTNEIGSSARKLLEKYYYGELTEDQSARFDALQSKFDFIYGNRDMLDATDWRESVKRNKYFGFYGWVISHTDANNTQIKDKDGVPHQGQNKEGRLAFIQFKSNAFINAWNAFVTGKQATGAAPEQWLPQLFHRGDWHQIALSISYAQAPDKKFFGSVTELWFQTQIAHMVNDRAVNPSAYHILPEWISDAKDLSKELINTNIEGSLFEDYHITQFENAVKAVMNSFDYYNQHGSDAYSVYAAACKFNDSSEVAPQPEDAPAAPTVIPNTFTNPLATPGIPAAPVGQPAPGMGQMPPAFGQPAPTMPGQVPPMPAQSPSVTPTDPQQNMGQMPPVNPGQFSGMPPVTPAAPQHSGTAQPSFPGTGTVPPAFGNMPGQPSAPTAPAWGSGAPAWNTPTTEQK